MLSVASPDSPMTSATCRGSTPMVSLIRARSSVTSSSIPDAGLLADELNKILVAGDHHHDHPCTSSLRESVPMRSSASYPGHLKDGQPVGRRDLLM